MRRIIITYGEKIIEEYMEKVKTAVAELVTSPKNLVGYQEVDFHMISYIKLG